MMTKKIRFHLFVVCEFICLIMVFIRCTKDEPKPIGQTLIQNDLWGLLYQKGSFWVYQDSFTGQIDTTNISDSRLIYIAVGSSQTGRVSYQVYSMTYENFINAKQRQIDAARYALYNTFSPPSDYNWFFYRFEDPTDTTIGGIRPKGHINNFVVGNNIYPKVYVIEHDSLNDKNSGTFHRVYISDSFGLVQYSLFRKHQMYQNSKLIHQELVRYNMK